MITSTMGRMAEAEKLSIPQLQMAIKDGSLPAYIGIPLLQDKMKQTQQAKMAQAGTQPQQPPVAQQVMQQASQMGIDHLRSNLPTEGMAGGGIIAFEDGGHVPRYANRGLVKLSREQYDSLTPDMQQVYVNQYGAPPPSTVPAGNQLNPIGLNTAPPSPAVLAAMQGTPLQPQAQQAPGVTALPAVNAATGAPVANATSPYLNPSQAQGIQTALNTNAAADATATGTPKAGLTSLITKPTDITADKLSDLGADYQAILAANPGMSAEEAMARRETMLGTDTGRDEIRQKLKDMEAKTSKDEEKAPWMALMKAGLATMAGTSPYALSNIGKGGMEGVADYAAAQDRVEKAREKQLDINQRIAQADRAEKVAAVDYGLNSEERDKARAEKIRLEALATKTHVLGVNATNDLNAAEHNQSAGLEYSKALSTEEHQRQQIQVAREANQVALENKLYGLDLKTKQLYRDLDTKADAEMSNLLKLPKNQDLSTAEYNQLRDDTYAKLLKANGLPPLSDAPGMEYLGIKK